MVTLSHVCYMFSIRMSPPPPAPGPDPFAEESNPFDDHDHDEPWALQGRVEELADLFAQYGPENGKLPGGAAKKALVDTGVDKKILRNLWPLADVDKDGTYRGGWTTMA